jgi:hypothetical protein
VWAKGKLWAAVKIGMMNLIYNMRRLHFLRRPNPPEARDVRVGSRRGYPPTSTEAEKTDQSNKWVKVIVAQMMRTQ